MKRRVFTRLCPSAVLRPGLRRPTRCRTLQETPMFADQVKSGALPPVDKRIPAAALDRRAVRRRRRSRPAGRPAQHAGRERARHAPDDALQLHAADRLRRPVQAAARHPRELRGQGRPRVHLQAARRPQMVGRPALHHRGLPLLLGRRRQQQGTVAVAARRSSCWSTASRPRSRSSTSARSSTAGTSPIPTSSKARRAPRRSSCSGRRTTSRSSTPSTRPTRRSPSRPRAARAAAGCRSTGATT